MASIVTSKFRIHNAEQFVEAFSEASNTIMYLFIGKSTAFPDDNAPPTPVNSTANIEFTPWREMYGAKRVNSSMLLMQFQDMTGHLAQFMIITMIKTQIFWMMTSM
jgi:hypothetical protein